MKCLQVRRIKINLRMNIRKLCKKSGIHCHNILAFMYCKIESIKLDTLLHICERSL